MRVIAVGIIALVGCGTGAQPQPRQTGRAVKPAVTIADAPIETPDASAADAATAPSIEDTAPTSTPTPTPTSTPTSTSTSPPTSTSTSPPTSTPPVAAAWPASVGLADRTPCSYRCMNNGQSVDSADLERHLSKQLGAIRQCSRQSNENRVVQSDAQFGADGRLTFTIESGAVRRQMQECMSRIPSPSYFKGPLNTHWKCADYCQ